MLRGVGTTIPSKLKMTSTDFLNMNSTMMQGRLFFAVFMVLYVFSIPASAQSSRERRFMGHVMDSFTGAAIPDVEVTLLRGDSTLVESRKVDVGYFESLTQQQSVYDFFVTENRKAGQDYIIKASHPQYETSWLSFTSKKYGRRYYVSLPDIHMRRKGGLFDAALDEVTVTATKIKMYHKGDTLVFNADAFNVPDGSMLDALIRQMPGTELKSNGEIFVNGKKIDYLLLNGQDFFRGRNKLMLQNLPYYTVEKIKVYDKTTERAEALHDETAPKDYVMDVNLKKEYRTGYMANMEAGGGNEKSYLGRLFGLRYSDHARLTLIGNSNNTSLSDNVGYNGEFYNDIMSADGVTTTHSGELDWLYSGRTYKNDLQVGYENNRTENGEIAFHETFHGTDGSTYGFNRKENTHRAQAIEVGNQFSMKAPFWLESKTMLRYRDVRSTEKEMGGNASANVWRERNVHFLDSLLRMGIPLNAHSVLNANHRQYVKSPWTATAMQSVDLAKDMTNGDVISLKLSFDHTESEHDATRREQYLFLQPSPYTRNKNEDITGGDRKTSLEAHLSYKFVNLWRSDWTLFADYRYGNNRQWEQLFNVDSQRLDEENSFDCRTHENVLISGLAYHCMSSSGRGRKDRLVTNLNLPVVVRNRSADYHRAVLDTCVSQHHVFFEPSLHAEYTKERNWLELKAAYSYMLPEVTQLIQMPLTRDLLHRYEGNASLKPSSEFSTTFSYKRTLRSINFLTNSISFAKSFDRIINSYIYYPEDGTYLFRPVNANGAWNVAYTSDCWYNLKESEKGKWSFFWNGVIRYAENVNYLAANDPASHSRSINKQLYVTQPIAFGYFHKDFECVLEGRFAWNHAFNNTSDVAFADAFDYGGGISLKKKIFWGISASTDFNVYLRSGYNGADINKPEYVWDFTFSRTLLKEKLTFRLSAVDVLRNRSSLSYTVNSQGVSEIQKTKIPGYLLLTACYRMHKLPKNTR